MAVISWNGAVNLDLKVAVQTFDFRTDVLQVADPSLQAQQFDLVEDGTNLALVKARDVNGVPLAAADVRYAFFPNMLIREVGGSEADPVSSNIVLSNGGQLWVGDRLTDTILDDAGNNATALATQLQSVQVWGLGGADTIATGDGNDRVYGNTGADSIHAGAGKDSVYGGQENDTLNGGAGDDNVAGDLGNDQVNGGSGNDIMYGGAGNDVLDPDIGNDTIFAGNGNDTVAIGNSDTGDKLVYMDKLQDLLNIISTTGSHVAYMGDGNDNAFLEANAGDIKVFGEQGNDILRSQSFGADTLDGGGDDDYLEVTDGAIGAKVMIGGDGDDEFAVLDGSSGGGLANTQVTVRGDEGADTITYARGLTIGDANNGGDGPDHIEFQSRTELTLRDQSIELIETVMWSGDDDEVKFADGNVGPGRTLFVFDAGGSDSIDGSRETDGTFSIESGEGNDTIIGGAGADTLNGGEQQDLMVGNGGADRFMMLLPYDSGHYTDVIQDFTGFTDKLMFNGNAFAGVSAINGYKGTAGDSATPNDNLLIATGQSYSIGSFDQFLTAGTADTDKPGFYIFYDVDFDRGEIWFDESMVSTDGAVLIAIFNNITAINQLNQFNEGPAGGNSGDFVII
ncbi:MAG: calcium-binding protein [Alphaproteobacteria bacterium]